MFQKHTFFIFSFILFSVYLSAQNNKKLKTKLIFSDNFNKDLTNWEVEFEKPATSTLKIVNQKMDVATTLGATIWFKNKLSGNLIITYDAIVLKDDCSFDRLSDLNAFWMASDSTLVIPKRDGKFESYNNIKLYYAGFGGHYNKFTRFRKYVSDSQKNILQEYQDAAHLLVANKKYSVKIIVNKGLVQYFVNDELFWNYQDTAVFQEGYFGFRTSKSHQRYDNFKVFEIK